MATQAIQVDRERLSCSICLDLLKDPVTISCGHSYCMSCINCCWDKDSEMKKTHSCPQCRHSFTPRPVLMKNIMLAELVEELKKSGVVNTPPAHLYAGPNDVACDFCSGPKLKALKFCRNCLAHFCEQHIQPHYEVLQWKRHILYDANSELRDNICALHGEVLQLYCYTDQTGICYYCTLEEHKGHYTSLQTRPWPLTEEQLKAEPTRGELLRYSCTMTLDPNTTDCRLLLSDGNKKVTCVGLELEYVDHPDRFTNCYQVMSRDGRSGRSYWEVSWSGKMVAIAVAYKSICRTKNEAPFGSSDKSWSLECCVASSRQRFNVFRHNNVRTRIPGPLSFKIGVYLDYTSGTLAYYRVPETMTETMTLIHKVQTKFIRPLHLGIGCFFIRDTAELTELK